MRGHGRAAALPLALASALALTGCAQQDGDKDWPAEGRLLGEQIRDDGRTPDEGSCRDAVMAYVEDNDAPSSPANRGAMREACERVPAEPS